MCDTALCNAMALCGHCFDAKCAEGATQIASPPKKRKKAGGNNKLNLSPADKLKHDNQIKLDSSRRKRAKAKADNVTVLKLQHECGRLRQESDARCEEHSAEITRLKQEITQMREYRRKHETVLREARTHAIRWMERAYGKVSLLSLMYML